MNNNPIEQRMKFPPKVKLVTSTMPEGLSIGEEGDPQNDQQVQSMFFNMMTGNIQVTQYLNKKLVKKS